MEEKTTAFVSLLRIKPSVPVTAMTDEKQITLSRSWLVPTVTWARIDNVATLVLLLV